MNSMFCYSIILELEYGTNRIAAKSLDLGALQAGSNLLGLMLVKWVIAWFLLTK